MGTTHKSYRNIEKLLNYIGVKVEWLGTKERHIWNMITQPNEVEKEFTDKWIETIEEGMIKAVSYRRKIPIETVRNIRNRLFSPKEALENKLIDEIGTFEEFKDLNFPNNPVQTINLNTKGYAKGSLEAKEEAVLMKVKQYIEEPAYQMFSVEDVGAGLMK